MKNKFVYDPVMYYDEVEDVVKRTIVDLLGVEPEDVTTKGVTWTSSDEKIVKVTENGLLTAIGKGQATITATYKIGDETLTATYVVKVNESSVTPVNPGNKNDPTVAPNKALPNTGIGITIALIGSIILITICGIAVFSKYKKEKDVN